MWKGSYEGREVAFKSIRGITLSDATARLKRKSVGGGAITTQSNNSINTGAFSPSCSERNFLHSVVFISGLRALIHAEGSARVLSDDIPETTRPISCSAVVVCGTGIIAILDES